MDFIWAIFDLRFTVSKTRYILLNSQMAPTSYQKPTSISHGQSSQPPSQRPWKSKSHSTSSPCVWTVCLPWTRSLRYNLGRSTTRNSLACRFQWFDTLFCQVQWPVDPKSPMVLNLMLPNGWLKVWSNMLSRNHQFFCFLSQGLGWRKSIWQPSPRFARFSLQPAWWRSGRSWAGCCCWKA